MHISLGLTASVREVGFCFGEGEPMPLFGENFVIIDYDGVAFHITIHAGIYETIPANAMPKFRDFVGRMAKCCRKANRKNRRKPLPAAHRRHLDCGIIGRNLFRQQEPMQGPNHCPAAFDGLVGVPDRPQVSR